MMLSSCKFNLLRVPWAYHVATDLQHKRQKEGTHTLTKHSFDKSLIKQAYKIISERSLSCFQTASIRHKLLPFCESLQLER